MVTKFQIGEAFSGELISLQRFENGGYSRPFYVAIIAHTASGGRYLVIRFQGDDTLTAAFDLPQLPDRIVPLNGFQFMEGIDREIAGIDPDFLLAPES